MNSIMISQEDRITQHMMNLLLSPLTKASYRSAVEAFLSWVYTTRPGSPVEAVASYRNHMLDLGLAPATCNRILSAVRRWFDAAAHLGVLTDAELASIKNVENVKQQGKKVGTWLSAEEAQTILRSLPTTTLENLRDRAVMAVFLGVGLRIDEVTHLKWENIDQLDGVWVFRNIQRKHHRIQTIRIPEWVVDVLNQYGDALPVKDEFVFVSCSKANSGCSLTNRAVYNIVKRYTDVAPHQLRKTWSALAYKGGASIREIQQQLGHQSAKTTEIYLEDIKAVQNNAVNMTGLKL